mgnify:CR=1 FL=1
MLGSRSLRLASLKIQLEIISPPVYPDLLNARARSPFRVGISLAFSSDPQDLFRLIRQAGAYMAIPLVLVGGPCLGFLVGRYLDQRFGTDPWGISAAVLLGLIGSILEAIRLIRHVQR